MAQTLANKARTLCRWNPQQNEAFVCHVTLLRNEVRRPQSDERRDIQAASSGEGGPRC